MKITATLMLALLHSFTALPQTPAPTPNLTIHATPVQNSTGNIKEPQPNPVFYTCGGYIPYGTYACVDANVPNEGVLCHSCVLVTGDAGSQCIVNNLCDLAKDGSCWSPNPLEAFCV